MQQNGFGEAVNSWINTGPNTAVAPDQIPDALGPDVIDTLSRRTGLSKDQVLQILSQILPNAVDQLTPQGRLPTQQEMARLMELRQKRLLRRSNQHRVGRSHEMSVLGWILLGLIAGFIASKIVNREGQGFLLDIVLGIVGAVVGGFLFSAIGATGITGFNLYSMFVAVVGATGLLWLYHAFAGRR